MSNFDDRETHSECSDDSDRDGEAWPMKGTIPSDQSNKIANPPAPYEATECLGKPQREFDVECSRSEVGRNEAWSIHRQSNEH
jgi:hypothetical protein